MRHRTNPRPKVEGDGLAGLVERHLFEAILLQRPKARALSWFGPRSRGIFIPAVCGVQTEEAGVDTERIARLSKLMLPSLWPLGMGSRIATKKSLYSRADKRQELRCR